MAPLPAPEGSAAARFAALLRHHMRVGTRPAAKRGVGAWSPDRLAAEVGVSRRTIDNYGSGSTLPPDPSAIADAFFLDDPRHAMKRNEFLIAYAEATGTEAPPWAFAASNIPIRVPAHFTGRDDALVAVHSILSRYEGRVAITALHGMRGVGKTTLAAAYAHRNRATYRATWWIRAQSEATLRADIVALGVKLGWVGADEEEEQAVIAVMDRIQQEGEGILLIYDNALDARRLERHLPRGGSARVIITSNAHDWRGVAQPVNVRLWPKVIGSDYLISRTGRTTERHDAEVLSETLGGLPLAHEQAAAYCERLDVAFAEYGKRFAERPAHYLDDQRHASLEYHDGRTVAKTFQLGIEAAANEHPAAEHLVVCMAMLAPEPIPLFLLREGYSALGDPLVALLRGDGLDEAIAALRAFALVDREVILDEREPSVTTDAIRLHRLIREVAAARLTDARKEDARRALVKCLASVLPANIMEEPKSWPRVRRLDTLVLALAGNDSAVPVGVEKQAIIIMGCIAELRQAMGSYLSAKPIFERTIEICENTIGLNDPLTAESLNNFGLLLGDLGQTADALRFFRRALAIWERTLGPEHSETAKGLTNIAGALSDQGDLAQARTLHERALQIWERANGREHPLVAASLNNLANVLYLQGDFPGSLSHFEKALAIREAVLGPKHPRTATILNNIAVTLRAQGELKAALPYIERALAIDEEAMGAEHPSTAHSLDSLGRILFVMGDLSRSRPLLERAVAIREKALGLDHPQTATSLSNLAELLRVEGDVSGAQLLFLRVLKIRECALGDQHKKTVQTAQHIANLLADLGRAEEALNIRTRYKI